jgi:hypothetical protein
VPRSQLDTPLSEDELAARIELERQLRLLAKEEAKTKRLVLWHERSNQFLVVASGLLVPIAILGPADLILIFAVHLSGTLADMVHIIFLVFALVHYARIENGLIKWLREQLGHK